MTTKALSEAEKMRRVPGIVFVDGPTGRRARLAGTDVDVWQIVSAYRVIGNDRTQFYEAFDWLTPEQFNAAFDYYRAFPREFDELLGRESRHTRDGGAAAQRPEPPRTPRPGGKIAPL